MVIACDFDGTIVEHRYPAIGEERPFACEVLRRLINDRHKLILWTVREGRLLDEALDSDSSELFNEAKNKNFSCKLNADVFIDDKNINGLPSWTDIYEIITRGVTYEQLIRRRVREEMAAPAEPPYPKWMFWKHSTSHR